MKPKVSVVTPAYNAERYIARAIRSVLRQTLSDVEMIVVDDGSSDRTLQAVLEINDPRVRLFVNRENRGPSHARNRAIDVARGEWVALLDADDWYDDRRLDVLVQQGEQLGADIVCDDHFLLVEGDTRPWSTYLREKAVSFDNPRIISTVEAVERDFGPFKPMFRKEFLDQSGVRYREDLRYGEDFTFLLECLLSGARFVLISEAMYYVMSRPGSLGADTLRLLQQTLAETERLINGIRRNNDSGLLRVLQKREKRIRKSLMLYENIISPLKSGQIGFALSRVICHPSSLLVLADAVSQSLQYRLHRWRMRFRE